MPDLRPSRAFSDLIGSIYDCALDPSRWEKTLVDVMQAADCHTAVLNLSDLRNNRIMIDTTVGIPPRWMQEILKHIPEIHARLGEALASWRSLDDPYVISRHLPPSYAEASPYVQQCLKPQGIVDVMQFFLMHEEERFAGFALARHERQGLVDEELIELAKLLLPHIRRAVTISNVLDARTLERARMSDALDAFKCGVVLTDREGTILHANEAATQMLRNGGPIEDKRGLLRGKDAAAAAELRNAIRLAAQDETGVGTAGLAIRLTDTDDLPLFAHVLPLTGGEFRTRLDPAAVAAVFIGAPSDEQDAADTIRRAYDLTRAEARLLATLLRGQTLSEGATALGVARTTARTHLARIFSKTGVSRQADLMRLAARAAPPTARKDQG
jgi:DNA-binding CsgD family transcriptional regulator/PAS domain-containing protein